ncbi:MaoC family dehydratase N-terminal domain-containing protein [Nocardia sp. NPDC049707]|uniref:MaoC family dehydratase N-terminal domain-containing protein n=1 Tax=Nocardia sp. NPDC049707 TaxID=3154735 RepID=UPI003433A11A
MSINRSAIGRTYPPLQLLVTRSRLRNFAKATGQSDPVYIDLDAARRAGHRDLPVPPTFFFGVMLECPNPSEFLEEIGVDMRNALHGEQRFDYREMAYAGDELTATSTIVDIYDKKAGQLEFVVRDTEITNQNAAAIAALRTVMVVRHQSNRDSQ